MTLFIRLMPAVEVRVGRRTVPASASETVALRPQGVHIVTHTVRVTPPATVTRTRIRERVACRPSPSPTPVAASVTFACKVEQTGGGGEEYEVDTLGGAATAARPMSVSTVLRVRVTRSRPPR